MLIAVIMQVVTNAWFSIEANNPNLFGFPIANVASIGNDAVVARVAVSFNRVAV